MNTLACEKELVSPKALVAIIFYSEKGYCRCKNSDRSQK